MNYLTSPITNMPAPQGVEEREGDGFINLEHLLSMAKRQLGVVLIGAGVGLLFGLLYLQTTPPTYTATAKVLIDEGLDKIVDEVSTRPTNLQTQSEIMSQLEILGSARLAAVVVNKLNLDKNDSFLDPPSSLVQKSVGFLRGMTHYLRLGPAPGQAEAEMDEPPAKPRQRLSKRNKPPRCCRRM